MFNLPNFLVVGAAKSGTTSLFRYLKTHPEVYIPEEKEGRFFSQLPKNFKGLGAEQFVNNGITNFDEYKKFFENREERCLGDISNDYLFYYTQSIHNIKKYLKNDVKIIIILRNPIDRSYSNYLHALQEGWEYASFEEAIIYEIYRGKNNWAWPYLYTKVSMYSEQVNEYLKNFKNIKIFLYKDLKDTQKFLDDIFLFLGIEPIKIDTSQKFNISGIPRNKLLHNFLTKRNKLTTTARSFVELFLSQKSLSNYANKLKNKNIVKPEMKLETREYLKNIFKDDIYKLEALIKRDLSHWLR